MITSTMPWRDVDIEAQVRDYARRLGVDDEGAVLMALNRSIHCVHHGQKPEDAVGDACGLLLSWLRHPSNQRP